MPDNEHTPNPPLTKDETHAPSSSGIRRLSFLLSDSVFRALLAPAIVFIACCLSRAYQTDLWHHLARGRAMAERGELVNADIFTYTVPDQPFQDTNWLTQLLFWRLYSSGGLELVQTVNSLVRSRSRHGEPWRFGNEKEKVSPENRGYSDHFPVTVRLRVAP